MKNRFLRATLAATLLAAVSVGGLAIASPDDSDAGVDDPEVDEVDEVDDLDGLDDVDDLDNLDDLDGLDGLDEVEVDEFVPDLGDDDFKYPSPVAAGGDCAAMATQLGKILGGPQDPVLREILGEAEDSCRVDAWPQAFRDCVLTSTSFEGMDSCLADLPFPEAVDDVDVDVDVPVTVDDLAEIEGLDLDDLELDALREIDATDETDAADEIDEIDDLPEFDDPGNGNDA